MPSRERFIASAPKWLLIHIMQARWIHKTVWQRSSDERGKPDPELDVLAGPVAPAEGIASQRATTPDLHAVAVDIDMEAALIPSTTEGHYHLYFNKVVRWADYVKLLDGMLACGLIERGYYDTSIERGATYLRLPWIEKGNEHDRERSLPHLDSWLLEHGDLPRPTSHTAYGTDVLDPKLRGKDGTKRPPIIGIDTPSEREQTLAAMEADDADDPLAADRPADPFVF